MQSSMKNNNITLNEKKSMSMKSKKAIMGSIFIAPALIFIFIFLSEQESTYYLFLRESIFFYCIILLHIAIIFP